MTDRLDTRFADASESPGLALWRASTLWQRRIRAALAPHGITHTQFVLLASLAWLTGSGPVRQSALAEHTGMDAMTISQVLRTLESKGYVTRRPHPDDARAHAVAVTTAGSALADRANRDVEDADAAYFARLTASEQSVLVAALRTLSGEPTPAQALLGRRPQ